MELVLTLPFLIIIILMGLPIAFAIAFVALVLLMISGVDLIISAQRFYYGLQSFPLLSIPLFILSGIIMEKSDISLHLVKFATAIVGQLRGGLAMVNITTSMFFAGMSGTSMSDTAAVGKIMIPPMIAKGYSPEFTGAVTASSSTIGIIIPPSVPMIILASYMGISTGALFFAGFLPGLLLTFLLCFVAWLISIKNNYPVESKFSTKVLFKTFLEATPALIMPFIILGGILSGVFTPTEASSVAVVYGLCVGRFYYKKLNFKVTYGIFLEAAILNGAVMLVVAAAHVLGFAFTYMGFADILLTNLPMGEMQIEFFLIVMSLVLIVFGTFLDGIAMMYVTLPLFLPLIKVLGIDPIQFAMVVIICWGIGQQTPPVAAALFVTCEIAKVDMFKLTVANIPFIMTMILVLLIVIYFPQISTYIPSRYFG
jgi:TRAP-type transport system large permease protein